MPDNDRPNDPQASDDFFASLPSANPRVPDADEGQQSIPGTRRAAREAREAPSDEVDGLEALFAPEQQVAPPRRRSKAKRKRGCLIGLIVALVVVGGIVAGGVAVWSTFGDRISDALGWGPAKDYESGKATGEVQVTIQEGDNGSSVSQRLFEAGVTKTSSVFYDMLIDENIAVTFYPGVYQMQEKMTAKAALDALQNEDNRLENTAGVPEGSTIENFLPSVGESLGIPLKDLQAAAKKPSDYGVDASSLEGWLFPAVYEFGPDVDARDVIKAMVDRTKQSLADAGVPDDQAQRVLTIASIIQREGRVADFDKVSRVIQNRVDDGMMLQMDSTAQYGYGELHKGSVSTSEEAQHDDNPWNTYVIEGLPQTPIATPSDAAIDAAMHPADGPWLYFVTVNPESGETVFSETYEEHQKAIQQWDQWCQDNGNPENGCAG